MSTVAPETSPLGPVVSLENLLFDYPGADVTLRSCDSYEFRVLRIYIFHSSPALGEQVLAADYPQSGAAPTDIAATSLPVVQLSDSGAVLFSLLTYIFPVQPILPSTVEQVVELLSAAQAYKMNAILVHIRNHIAQQHPPFLQEENSLDIYSLAQRHGLRQEVLQAARSTLGFLTLTIDYLDEKFEMMPGAYLHELWKYHVRVRANLTSNLQDFVASHAHATFLKGPCGIPPGPVPSGAPSSDPSVSSGVPIWLDQYISSIGRTPSRFDLSLFHLVLRYHIQSDSQHGGCPACATISNKSILEFWAALSAVYRDSITKAESDLLLIEGGTDFEGHTISPRRCLSQLRYTHMPDADVIFQSSDLVNFRVRKSILATSSPFFEDLFSLPQPSDQQVVDDLPVVHLPEDAEVLNSLITMLYPVPPEMPDSDDKILALLAACQKYDMTTVQSSIRVEVSRRGLLSPTGAECFRLFAVAYRKGLIPEMKSAAHLTLGHPMTFEYLGEALRSFQGCALFDLSRFHRWYRNGIISRLRVFLDRRSGLSKVWVDCPPTWHFEDGNRNLPSWLRSIIRLKIGQHYNFTSRLDTASSFREEYMKALRGHINEKDCTFCMKTHALKGEELCVEIENILTQARDVQYSFRIELPVWRFTQQPSHVDLRFSIASASGGPSELRNVIINTEVGFVYVGHANIGFLPVSIDDRHIDWSVGPP
ncbi:hypothetical protein BJY52DRAFT_1187287 [Lactarius psammicola]|nr:hypothetical protein BJY52DRAFT_1187287 [Lactarius psammicola]